MVVSDEEVDSEEDSDSSSSYRGSVRSVKLSTRVCDSKNCFSYASSTALGCPDPAKGPSSKSKPLNILQKLYNREICGNFSPRSRAPNQRLFDTIPKRNHIRLKDVLPKYAILQNHICMGLSKCGNFLLTYTMEVDSVVCASVYKYRLHWFLFIPFVRARKVSEVMLFANQDVHCDLHISVSQWPTDCTRLLVYGYCVANCSYGHSHVTMTTVPALNKCQDCLNVAASYEEDDLAAEWDSCVRLSCLKHGLTIHTHFEVVSPFPAFDAVVSMKRDGAVLFNTGNFLHIVRAELENVNPAARALAQHDGKRESSPTSPVNTLETFNRSDAAVLLADGSPPPTNRMGAFLATCGTSSGNRLSGLDDGNRREDFWNKLGGGKNPGESTEGSEKSFKSAESGSDDPRTERKAGRRRDSVDTVLTAKWETGGEEDEGKTYANLDDAKEDVKLNEDLYRDTKATTSDIKPSINSEDDNKDRCAAWDETATEKATTSDIKPSIDSEDGNKDRCAAWNETANEKVDEDCLTDRERILRDFSDEVFLGQGVKRAKVDRSADSNKRARLYDLVPNRCLDDRLELNLDPGTDEESTVTLSSSPVTLSSSPVTLSSSPVTLSSSPATLSSSPATMGHRAVMLTNQELNIACGFSEAGLRSPPASLLMLSPAAGKRSCRKTRGVGPTVRLSSPAPQAIREAHTPMREAETVYEFSEDATPDSCEKLSSFRRRRLADKKYEFCDEAEDAENIVPYRIHRKRDSSPVDRLLRSPPMYLPPTPMQLKACSPRSPCGEVAGQGGEPDKSVLRPFNRNVAGICLLSPKHSGKKVVAAEPPAKPPVEVTPPVAVAPPDRFTTQYYRRYIEVEDELVSVITDIEDEDGPTGSPAYQLALPLEVHGAGYTQLQMISQCKAEKLVAPCAVVHQMSFDVERFCNDFAARLCETAGKKYSFCNDYDVEILDVCPHTGDVIVVAMMRIQILLSEGVQAHKQYQGNCTFVWNMDTGLHQLICTTPLTDVGPFKPGSTGSDKPWGPAQQAARLLRQTLEAIPVRSAVRTISNELTFQDESLVSILDMENLFQFGL